MIDSFFLGQGDYALFLLGEDFLVYCISFPQCIRISISFLRWIQSSVVWLWYLWKRQYLVLSTPAFGAVSFENSISSSLKFTKVHLAEILSLNIIRGVYIRRINDLLFGAFLDFAFLEGASWRIQFEDLRSLILTSYLHTNLPCTLYRPLPPLWAQPESWLVNPDNLFEVDSWSETFF